MSLFFRKVELHPSIQGWSMGHLAASLMHNFRFDGIEYDRCIDTSSGAFPIRYFPFTKNHFGVLIKSLLIVHGWIFFIQNIFFH